MSIIISGKSKPQDLLHNAVEVNLASSPIAAARSVPSDPCLPVYIHINALGGGTIQPLRLRNSDSCRSTLQGLSSPTPHWNSPGQPPLHLLLRLIRLRRCTSSGFLIVVFFILDFFIFYFRKNKK